MFEKTIITKISKAFDNGLKNSAIKKTVQKIAYYWKKTFFATITKFKPKKCFYFSEAKGKKVFLDSKTFGFTIKISNALFSTIGKKTLFPKWLIEKVEKKKLVMLGTMILITALAYLVKIFYTNMGQKNLYIGTLLLLASIIFITFGTAFEKHKKTSLFYNWLKNFWEQTRI